jgi:hypothetical protein
LDEDASQVRFCTSGKKRQSGKIRGPRATVNKWSYNRHVVTLSTRSIILITQVTMGSPQASSFKLPPLRTSGDGGKSAGDYRGQISCACPARSRATAAHTVTALAFRP